MAKNLKILVLVVGACGLIFAARYFLFEQKDYSHLILTQEKNFKKLKQLTFGGQNAEAYFSSDNSELIFQSTPPDKQCDQIYTMDLDGSDRRLVSTGRGKTTCSYFFNDMERIFFSSTHHLDPQCPPKPDYSKGYVWPLDEYDIFTAKKDGSDIIQLTQTPGYDAEGTLSPDGKTIIFTSMRNGDLDIYTMKTDGTDVKQLTDELGYDGGAFFSADGEFIVYRAYHPETNEDIQAYQKLLQEKKIKPFNLQIFIMNKDGTNKRQVTHLPGSNFAPFMHPDGKRIIFSSNHLDPHGRNFDLFMINVDGTNLKQITYEPTFDGFPMFSKDGTKLAFASNRGASKERETNVFIADWKE